ncbi:hypothetical protein OG481_04130 [Streptomyces longwoodensis]|uniref:hypothetical protein n=1 Tax=Streptomyces longwoodensis TaxID=68231 RepID=UPI002DDC20DD|nr:hypothetical protein [Streptomyces longwoodensis]WRY87761.1 hypothetical protein OG481_04130 [Streptomyces longwoodensis]
MSWTRALPAALAVCVLLLTGSVGCDSGGDRHTNQQQGRQESQEGRPSPGSQGAGESTAPVGKVLEDTDEDGRHYRQVDGARAPEVGIEVQPDSDGSWDVRLTLRHFRLSPQGTPARAVAGRGFARLYVDHTPVADLRTPAHRIPAGYLPHGTHQVTARLYADDGTGWAVDGKPVQRTADITASGQGAPAPGGPAS